MSLPADSHVHTEWSWDAQHGSMQRSCARAVELGLPSVAFTEHVDHTVWTVDREALGRLPADHPVAVLSDTAGRVHLVGDSDAFSVLAHIDYPVRSWPAERSFDPVSYEAEFRHALRATARSGKALEISTVVPLAATVVRWWHEEGGTAVSFGSDAHEPDRVADGFAAAAALAEANGFRPAADPLALWTRS